MKYIEIFPIHLLSFGKLTNSMHFGRVNQSNQLYFLILYFVLTATHTYIHSIMWIYSNHTTHWKMLFKFLYSYLNAYFLFFLPTSFVCTYAIPHFVETAISFSLSRCLSLSFSSSFSRGSHYKLCRLLWLNWTETALRQAPRSNDILIFQSEHMPYLTHIHYPLQIVFLLFHSSNNNCNNSNNSDEDDDNNISFTKWKCKTF